MFDQFPADVQKSVEGLVWLGYLEDTFEFCGHTFGIRTLYGNEELQASLLCKEYTDTLGQVKAWTWAHVALALTSVDGKQDFCPSIGPDEMEHARAKFKYVTTRWFWPVAEYIFTRFAVLQQNQLKAIEAVQDLSNRSLRPSSPLSDFLNEQGDSPSETVSDEAS